MKNHVLAFLLSAAILAGCSETVNTQGQVILPSRLAQVTPGTTTKDQVLQLLGSPSAQGTMNDNRWSYITSVVGTKAFEPHNLKERRVIVVDFDPSSSIVASIGEKTKDDGKELLPDPAATKTQGQTMGIVEQLMGNLGLGAK
jgi:outer membrane protein assembly factor BamE (lipoprotein component of BamABCDE complex)